MPRLVKKCHGCKQEFRASELTYYCTLAAQNGFYYCPDCLAEKQMREKFSNAVCEIFGLKAPGPRIWTERKRLRDSYGYTDETIIDCLGYIYKTKGLKKLAESLCLVNPVTVDEMMQYRQRQQNRAASLTNALATEMTEYIVPIKEQTDNKKKKKLNPEDFLED